MSAIATKEAVAILIPIARKAGRWLWRVAKATMHKDLKAMLEAEMDYLEKREEKLLSLREQGVSVSAKLKKNQSRYKEVLAAYGKVQ